MKQQIMHFLGIGLLAIGLIVLFCLAFGFQILKFFFIPPVYSEIPNQGFKHLQCPPQVMQVYETNNISLTILNPLNETGLYQLSIRIFDKGVQVENEMAYEIAGNQAAYIIFPVTFPYTGDMVIRIEALAKKEISLPNSSIFIWETKFTGGCEIRVRPLSDQTIYFLGFCSVLLGLVLFISVNIEFLRKLSFLRWMQRRFTSRSMSESGEDQKRLPIFRRKRFFFGMVLIFSGCLEGLYLAINNDPPKIMGLFNREYSSDPYDNQGFKNFQCPPRISQVNETYNLNATIFNPFNANIHYSIFVNDYDLGVLLATHEMYRSVPANQETQITWPVTFTEVGEQIIGISAYSNDYVVNSSDGPWANSYAGECVTRVLDNRVDLLVGIFGIISVLTGICLFIPAIRASIRNRSFMRFFRRTMLLIGISLMIVDSFIFLFQKSTLAMFPFPISSNMVNQSFKKFQCSPTVVKPNGNSIVFATILNPTHETLVYSIDIEEYISRADTVHHKMQRTLAGDQSVDITWVITPTKNDNIYVRILAISNKDPYVYPQPNAYSWPTSFVGICRLLVVDGPLADFPPKYPGFLCLMIGAVLFIPAIIARIKRRL